MSNALYMHKNAANENRCLHTENEVADFKKVELEIEKYTKITFTVNCSP